MGQRAELGQVQAAQRRCEERGRDRGPGGRGGRAPRLGTGVPAVTEGVTARARACAGRASSRVQWEARPVWRRGKRARADVLGRGLRFREGKGLGRQAGCRALLWVRRPGGARMHTGLGGSSPQDLGPREMEGEAEEERAAWGIQGRVASLEAREWPECLGSCPRNPPEWQGHTCWPSASCGGQRHPVSGGILPSSQGGVCPCLFPDTSGGRTVEMGAFGGPRERCSSHATVSAAGVNELYSHRNLSRCLGGESLPPTPKGTTVGGRHSLVRPSAAPGPPR